jgi:hypothetical protein
VVHEPTNKALAVGVKAAVVPDDTPDALPPEVIRDGTLTEPGIT